MSCKLFMRDWAVEFSILIVAAKNRRLAAIFDQIIISVAALVEIDRF
jgi:hypothetical protein